MQKIIITSLYLLILAVIHAKLELQIEGKRMGWAFNLPCWKKENKFIDWLLGKKPLTGYHVWLLIMFLFLFHSIYLFIPLSLKNETILMGLFFWYWIVEDFLWFVENPYYQLRNFKRGRIYWHKRWIGKRIPVSYLISAIIGTTLLLLGRK